MNEIYDNDMSEIENEDIAETVDDDENTAEWPGIVISVSSGDAYDDTALIESVESMHTDIINRLDYLTNVIQITPEPEEQYTLWNAPLDSYSVTDGLLLLTLIVVLAMFAKSFFGGMIWHK